MVEGRPLVSFGNLPLTLMSKLSVSRPSAPVPRHMAGQSVLGCTCPFGGFFPSSRTTKYLVEVMGSAVAGSSRGEMIV